MLNIDVKDLKEIKEELDSLDNGEDVIFICDEDETKYAILPIETFDDLESCKDIIDGKLQEGPAVKIISSAKNELTYEEYEKIKKQLVDVFDKTFKPNPNKLN